VVRSYGAWSRPGLAKLFAEIEQLRASVVYPFLLRLYSDFSAGGLSDSEFATILNAVTSYVFRRAVCRIPTNSLNKTFASLGSSIDPRNYVESIWGRLLTLPTYKRFPSDGEFIESLQTEDLYNFQRAPYFFRKMENHGRKEEVSTAEYSIEHIMPHNENLSAAWKSALGDDWQNIHERYLHTLGNLTLTGYNPEYSDKPFAAKRDMAGGFKDSPLRLNQGLGQLDNWNATEIKSRATRLAAEAVGIWQRPRLDDVVLARYREQFSEKGGFDWTMAHLILEAIPEGNWTSYHYIAEAVGTAPQAVGNHLASCGECPNPHRVLTWDGRVADNFHWLDPEDDRIPVEILRSEGIRIEDHSADMEQQLVVEDLLALVGDID
jgi:alkylated DNA nucleotide flippase Atl1